ncbi:MAG: alanine racemase [Deltaproteobacteria bacterium]|nr:alanine racemase [Deltaproteobacteria bacterium]
METRPTVAVVDTGALKANYAELKKRASGTTRIMAIVKANAYGHGDVEAARAFALEGCAYFGVATVEEGARLRAGKVDGNIIVLGGVYAGQIKDVFDLDLTPVVFDLGTAKRINERGRALGVTKKIHVKIDTGMGRIGLLPEEVAPFFEGFKALSNLKLESVLSHFVEAESKDKEYTRGQLARFLKVVEVIKSYGFTPDFIDMANSAAAVDYKDSHLGLIRPGIMLYGSYPAESFREKITLRPALTLKTRILHLKKVGPGFNVSYGRRFTTRKESIIATLPIGYGDGVPRKLTGIGEALIHGRRAPLIGTVCMDLTMCDCTEVPGVAVGDEAVIIGRQGTEEITAEEIAVKTGTISYEVFCNISSRVPRVYV